MGGVVSFMIRQLNTGKSPRYPMKRILREHRASLEAEEGEEFCARAEN